MKSTLFLATAGLLLCSVSCERHEWEDVKIHHEPHGAHAGHGEHSGHGEGAAPAEEAH
jgi:hypothetical protein